MRHFLSVGMVLFCLGSKVPNAFGSPSQDWRRQVIYFALVDRFANGNSANDTAHGDDVCNDRNNPHAFQGGDLVGLTNQLGYIESLGATTLWLTPLYKGVAAMQGVNCGFPGYWADFSLPNHPEIDPRFGTPEDFDRLISEAHDRNIKVILDMVVNHAGYNAELTRLRPAWFTEPFSCHWQGAPEIYCPLAGLPDFDLRREDVRDYLVDGHRAWLQRFAFDGIRMDTVKHVQPEFFREWIPAMRQQRPDLYVIGELLDERSFDAFDRYIEAGFDGLFNFPLRTALIASFAKGQSVDIAASRMQETLQRFGEDRAAYMVNLLDNHDVQRFVNEIPYGIGSDDSRHRYLLAMTALLTLPGIPQIYYGNEVGMDGGGDPHNRRFMPAWAFDAHERRGDYPGHLARPDLIYQHVQKLLTIRKQHAALQIGSYREVWRQNGAHQANVWAFYREAGSENSRVIVALNNGYNPPDAPLPIMVEGKFSEGTVLEDILGQAGIGPLTVRDGRIELTLPGQTAVILVSRR